MSWIDNMPTGERADLRDAGRLGSTRLDGPVKDYCGNCKAYTSDLQVLDYGKRGTWNVCNVCLSKWRA